MTVGEKLELKKKYEHCSVKELAEHLKTTGKPLSALTYLWGDMEPYHNVHYYADPDTPDVIYDDWHSIGD